MSVDYTPPGDGTPRLHAVPPPTDADIPYDPYYDNDPSYSNTRPVDPTIQTEQALLGAMLINPNVIDAVTQIIEPGDYRSWHHEQIHDAITSLHNSGHPIDMVTVAEELLRRPGKTPKTTQLIDIGGGPYLHQCQQATPTASNATYYAEKVRDHARLRAIKKAATKLDQLSEASLDQADKVIGDALTALEHADLRSIPGIPDHHNTGRRDLAWVLTGQAPTMAPPAYTHRADGNALFYAGKVNGVFGDPESGKTWLAQTAIVEALNSGGTAAMIDVDHNGADHTAGRLLLLGAHPAHIADPDRFRYYEPEENDELLAAVDEITAWAPNVYVLDSLGEVLPMMGVKSVDNDEITAALRRTCSPPAVAGSCVITIDHLPKGIDARQSGYAIGGTAKKRMMRGSYLRVETRVQPAPGSIGRSTIRIEKDTTGELRKVTPGGYAGTLVLDSTTPGITVWRVEREAPALNPTTGQLRPTGYMERISKYVEQNDQCSGRDIQEGVGGGAKYVKQALDLLIAEGFISTIPGQRRSTLHHSIAHYREAEDDHLNSPE